MGDGYEIQGIVNYRLLFNLIPLKSNNRFISLAINWEHHFILCFRTLAKLDQIVLFFCDPLFWIFLFHVINSLNLFISSALCGNNICLTVYISSITGIGEVCHDKIVLPCICFTSRRCKSWRTTLWKDSFDSTIHSAREFGYQTSLSKWNIMACKLHISIEMIFSGIWCLIPWMRGLISLAYIIDM